MGNAMSISSRQVDRRAEGQDDVNAVTIPLRSLGGDETSAAVRIDGADVPFAEFEAQVRLQLQDLVHDPEHLELALGPLAREATGNRFATYEDCVDGLIEQLNASLGTAYPTSDARRQPEPSAAWAQWLCVGTAVAGALGVGGALAWLAHRSRQASPPDVRPETSTAASTTAASTTAAQTTTAQTTTVPNTTAGTTAGTTTTSTAVPAPATPPVPRGNVTGVPPLDEVLRRIERRNPLFGSMLQALRDDCDDADIVFGLPVPSDTSDCTTVTTYGGPRMHIDIHCNAVRDYSPGNLMHEGGHAYRACSGDQIQAACEEIDALVDEAALLQLEASSNRTSSSGAHGLPALNAMNDVVRNGGQAPAASHPIYAYLLGWLQDRATLEEPAPASVEDVARQWGPYLAASAPRYQFMLATQTYAPAEDAPECATPQSR